MPARTIIAYRTVFVRVMVVAKMLFFEFIKIHFEYYEREILSLGNLNFVGKKKPLTRFRNKRFFFWLGFDFDLKRIIQKYIYY